MNEPLNLLNQICLKTFTRRPHLQEHMILHTQDRPFKCSFCDEYFKSRFARLKHQEKYHLGEKWTLKLNSQALQVNNKPLPPANGKCFFFLNSILK